jgi:pyrimidine deaminase RibD-like protein
MTRDEKFMREAIHLARQARGQTRPNPAVGCVLVKHGRIIARGWHRRAGLPHAEIEALRSLKNISAARGSTAYITLEPCSTHGRTPPCTDALIAAGVAGVVIGAIDPNPQHHGRGLSLLQKSGIKDIRGFGGFPVCGVWLRCDNPEVVARHKAKVYGKASVGAPPMSVPHLDTRVVEGNTSLLFGPYAGFTPKFLKNGSVTDLLASLRLHNIGPMLAVGLGNFSLVRYLVSEVFASRGKRLEALWGFYPSADPDDWYELTAGQRVQVIKPDRKKVGVLQFGTEVVTSADGSIAGLLGASPGASTAAAIMIDVLERCFPQRLGGWSKKLRGMVPSYGTKLSDDADLAYRSTSHTGSVLKL